MEFSALKISANFTLKTAELSFGSNPHLQNYYIFYKYIYYIDLYLTTNYFKSKWTNAKTCVNLKKSDSYLTLKVKLI